MTPEFFVTSLIVVLMPGTGVLYTLAFGIGSGWRASVVAAFGCTLGIVPHILASIAGLAALLHTSAVAFQVVKYLGVAYLFYMAWRVLREGGALRVSGGRTAASDVKIIVDGLLLNILNPKLSLFFLAFLPQFVPSNTSEPTHYMLGLAAIFMLLTFAIFVGYGAFASATRRYIISKPSVMAWFRRGFAGAFVALGMRLALSDR
ncbi:LysE family translocator [Aquisalimonas lutea]|uniref:LysE family translocator n=1 Tax=Aquisalimonas lutea TaxID=1327750 RepID=UPI0025B440A4|nr:LysE family translocator [Aquisalimonas lutea]MDN3517516.1 LysE family translocator [Aquisalimonas lutea]